MSNLDDQLREAEAAYHAAARGFSTAIEAWVGRKLRAAYPTATKLIALGEYHEDGAIRLRTQRVIDAAGAALGDVEDPTETFEKLVDLIDPYLDWLADINGEDYLGDHDFEIEEK